MHYCGYGAPKGMIILFGGGGDKKLRVFFCHQGVLVIMLINMHQKLCAETLMCIKWEC